ncbi:MAG: DNA repair protein RecN [Bdellovibrionota bacterium]
MLETLNIRNIAIIDLAEIQFKGGLNIISGETGTGKSIVIEAISLLLGGRASADLIRSGVEEASVEGLFDISKIDWIKPRLEKHGFEVADGSLLIKRLVSRSGKHRIFVNGQLATLSILQELCDGLIDLCGQHEHQSLLKASVQMELLDRYGGLEKQAAQVADIFKNWHALITQKEEMEKAQAERSSRADFLKFQMEEIKTAELKEGEDDSLQVEKNLLQTSEARVKAADAARQCLEAEREGALDAMRTALNRLKSLVPLDLSVAYIQDYLNRALAEAEEASMALNKYLEGIDLDGGRLEEIQDRLALLAQLRRKYGANATEILGHLARVEGEFQDLENTEGLIEELSKKAELAKVELLKCGKKLSQTRRKVAQLFSDSVTGELKDLKLEGAKFQIDLQSLDDLTQWSNWGADLIQFVVQTNPGEPAKPIGKIASGGELSRLMLAIRRVISDRGGIGVYLFDEIDAGIGGQTAFQVGKKLKSVAAQNQVICITHLPQVASFADHHLIVSKSVSGKRTVTEVLTLSGKKARQEELARMLGGSQLTKKSLENAAELLDLAR